MGAQMNENFVVFEKVDDEKCAYSRYKRRRYRRERPSKVSSTQGFGMGVAGVISPHSLLRTRANRAVSVDREHNASRLQFSMFCILDILGRNKTAPGGRLCVCCCRGSTPAACIHGVVFIESSPSMTLFRFSVPSELP